MKQKIFVSGGDKRLYFAFKSLLDKGYEVYYEKCPKMSDGFKYKITTSDVLLFGVPMTRDNKTLFAPFGNEDIYLSDIAKLTDSNKLLIGGKIPENQFNCKTEDLLLRDDFAILNAVPTAEGVLEIALHETDFCISGCECLVTGYGRIGKVICDKFKRLGANVTASARRESDIALAKAFGLKTVKTSEIKSRVQDFEIIVNTIPHLIFTDEVLDNVKSDTIIIDTASSPGGVDFPACNNLGIKTISAPSLPGKTAPKTAGEIIAETVLNIIT